MVGLSLRWVNHGGSIQGRYGLTFVPTRFEVLFWIYKNCTFRPNGGFLSTPLPHS